MTKKMTMEAETCEVAGDLELASTRGEGEGVLVLVRHGETVGNSAIRLYGATDIDLSPLGEAQVGRAAQALAGERFDQLVTSPMVRARRSAEIVARALRTPAPLRVVEALRERDFGAWEGWTAEEVAQRDPEGYRRWRTEGLNFCFPEGESRCGLQARVIAAVEGDGQGQGQGQAKGKGQLFPTAGRSLAVLHKGIIKVILGRLLGLDHDASHQLVVSLGSIHRLRYRGQDARWELEAGNLVDHLGEHFVVS